MTFSAASSVTPLGGGRFHFEIPDGWQQGRSTFGGLMLGGMLRAVEACEPDARRVPRSVNAELVGAVSGGAASIEVSLLRSGSSLSAFEARLTQGGELVARLSAVIAAAKSVPPVGLTATLGDTPKDWREVPVAPIRAPLAPVFTQHYEFRPIAGIPFTGFSGDATAGWVAEAARPERYDHASLLGLLDSYWPVSLVRSATVRAGATVSFMAEFFMNPSELDPTLPLYFKARALAEYEGYCLEVRELWSEGRLVAMNQQLFLMLT